MWKRYDTCAWILKAFMNVGDMISFLRCRSNTSSDLPWLAIQVILSSTLQFKAFSKQSLAFPGRIWNEYERAPSATFTSDLSFPSSCMRHFFFFVSSLEIARWSRILGIPGIVSSTSGADVSKDGIHSLFSSKAISVVTTISCTPFQGFQNFVWNDVPSLPRRICSGSPGLSARLKSEGIECKLRGPWMIPIASGSIFLFFMGVFYNWSPRTCPGCPGEAWFLATTYVAVRILAREISERRWNIRRWLLETIFRKLYLER